MPKSNDYWYRLLFKVKLYEASGYAFQGLVEHLYQYGVTGFQSIAPWGNWGDGGNDGWIPETGHYLQIYGPKATTAWQPTDAVKKATTDFAKLPKKWSDVERYSFVLNDRFTGTPAPVARSLQELQNKHRLLSARSVDCAALESLFMSLAEDQRQVIVGGLPATTPGFVDSRAVGELLSGLADRIAPMAFLMSKNDAPDFDEKIIFNGLTEPVASYLRLYSYQTSTLDDFLGKRDIGLGQAIAQEVRKLYKQSKAIIPASDHEAANLRYGWMMERLIPELPRQHPHSLKAYREAAQIVLAKYFETCDAYEHPSSALTT